MKEFINSMGIISIIMGIWSLFGGQTLSRSEGAWSILSSKNSFIGILIGIVLLIISKKYIKKISFKSEYSICPKCEESYTYSDLDDGMCPKCDVKTVDIEEYYKRNKNK